MTDGQENELDRLMQRAGAGDEAAFRRFYDATAPAILAFLMRMLRDRFLAEDVLQETMVTAWNKARDFDPSLAAAKTWITTIARRRALDLIRSRSRHAEVMDLWRARNTRRARPGSGTQRRDGVGADWRAARVLHGTTGCRGGCVHPAGVPRRAHVS